MPTLIWMLAVTTLAHEEGEASIGAPPDPALGLGQFTAVRAHVHSWIDFTQIAGSTRGNDVWGYVAPSGREYAFAGFDTVTAVVEVTDPDAPVIVAQLDHPDSNWSDVKTYQEHAYLSNETGGGVQVFDLTQIDLGIVTELAPVTNGGTQSRAHTIWLDETSGFLYTAGGDYGVGGSVFYDLTDPANPVYAGEWQGNYIHALHVVTWASGPDAGLQIAYVSGGNRGFQIVDVTDKANPQLLATLDYGPQGYTHQGWLDPTTRLFYQGDELDERQGVTATSTTWVIDVDDRMAPSVASTFTNFNTAIDHNLMVANGVVYEANYTSGLRIYDLAPNPLRPVEVGYVDTFPADDTQTFSGAWGVYALPSGTVLVQDIDGGFFVIGPEDATTTAPDAFSLALPADGSFVAPWRTSLEWDRPWGAWNQTLTVATDAALTQVTFQQRLPAHVVRKRVTTLGTAACTTYWWSVEGSNGIGDTTATATFSFSTGPVGDLDGSGVVDVVDRAIHDNMITVQNLAGDFDANGIVDTADRAILIANAGPC